MFTVKDGNRIFEIIGSKNLPAGLYKKWRNRQAAVCMSRKREKEREESDNQDTVPGPSVSPPVNELQLNSPLINLPQDLCRESTETQTSQSLNYVSQRSEETQTSQSLVERDPNSSKGQAAIKLIRCKVCLNRRVDRVMMPCGHMVLCGICLTNVYRTTKKCPICNKKILDHMLARLI